MKSSYVALISVIGLGMLVLFGWLGFYAYQQRQGPALDSTPAVVFVTSLPQIIPSATPETLVFPTATLAQPIPTATPEATSAPATVCGEDTAWNVLILGSVYGSQAGVKGSDLTQILRADFLNKKVSMYAFPRDLWVDTQDLGLTNPTINATRLGTVFYEGRIRSLQFAEINTIVDGTRVTARMLYRNFQVSADHYVSIDVIQMISLIDATGGLSINVPERITDPWIGMVIPAGQQKLTGVQVAAYARAIPDTEFGRMRRNQLLVEALRQKLLDPTSFINVPDLYARYKNVIATDLSLEQINHLSCLMKEIPASALIQDGVKQEWTSPGPQGSLAWNKDKILAHLKSLGLIP